MVLVAGVDGCQKGWVVALAEAQIPLVRPEILMVEDFEKVLATLAEIICIDVPIGLIPDRSQERGCDVQARQRLPKGRKSSVFPAPCRTLIEAFRDRTPSYPEASAISRRATGKGISRQTWAICPKIEQVDRLMTPGLQLRVREVHPELCFQALAPQRITSGKKKSRGQEQRVAALRPFYAGVDLVALPRPKGVARDDLLDALVGLVTAAKISAGEFEAVSEEPTPDAKHLQMEMVFPVVDPDTCVDLRADADHSTGIRVQPTKKQ